MGWFYTAQIKCYVYGIGLIMFITLTPSLLRRKWSNPLRILVERVESARVGGKMRLWHGQITLDYMGFSFIPSFGEFMPSCKLIQPLLANYLPIQNGATFHTPGPPLRWPWCPHASSSSAPRGPAPDPVFPYEKMNWFMKSSCARQNRQKNKKNIIV